MFDALIQYNMMCVSYIHIVVFAFVLVNCGIPMPPINGDVGNYTNSRVEQTTTFQCDEGYIPSGVVISTCTNLGLWTPEPEEHNCTLIIGKNKILCSMYTYYTIS